MYVVLWYIDSSGGSASDNQQAIGRQRRQTESVLQSRCWYVTLRNLIFVEFCFLFTWQLCYDLSFFSLFALLIYFMLLGFFILPFVSRSFLSSDCHLLSFLFLLTTHDSTPSHSIFMLTIHHSIPALFSPLITPLRLSSHHPSHPCLPPRSHILPLGPLVSTVLCEMITSVPVCERCLQVHRHIHVLHTECSTMCMYMYLYMCVHMYVYVCMSMFMYKIIYIHGHRLRSFIIVNIGTERKNENKIKQAKMTVQYKRTR